MTSPRNVSASIRQRLLNRARSDRRPFNELLQYFAMERFLYRLSQSTHADRYVLKEALMLQVWRSPDIRPAMDIDFLRRTSNAEVGLVILFQDILAITVGSDGLVFDLTSIWTDRIAEGTDYEGIRIRFPGALGNARIYMQIDVGFGDVVYPKPEVADYPTMLNFPAPRLLCYSRESAIAEKLEAMVKFGTLNCWMKDFYDIWLLSRQFDFHGPRLTEAIRMTFERRNTALPSAIEAFTEPFLNDRQTQRAAFRNRLQQDHVPATLKDIGLSLDRFLSPVVAALTFDLF